MELFAVFLRRRFESVDHGNRKHAAENSGEKIPVFGEPGGDRVASDGSGAFVMFQHQYICSGVNVGEDRGQGKRDRRNDQGRRLFPFPGPAQRIAAFQTVNNKNQRSGHAAQKRFGNNVYQQGL